MARLLHLIWFLKIHAFTTIQRTHSDMQENIFKLLEAFISRGYVDVYTPSFLVLRHLFLFIVMVFTVRDVQGGWIVPDKSHAISSLLYAADIYNVIKLHICHPH